MEKKKLRSFWEKLLIGILCYFLAAGGLYWVVKEDWHASDAAVLPVLSEHLADGLCADKTLHQTFKIHMDDLSAISVSGVGDAASVLRLQLYDGADLLWETSASGDCLHPGEQTRFEIEPALTNMRGKTVTLVAQTDAGSVSLWYGNAMSAGKFDVKVEALGELTIGNQPVEGSLALGQFGRDVMGADAFFWPVALMLGAMILCVAYWEHQQGIKGKRTLYAMLSGVIRQYRFLVKQLVSRDFKVKYKASALGVFWSFLNPLLTMTVYMVVFSTVFTSNIEHFPAYLISGIVLFNFFSESSSLGLRAMVDNAALIKKIYIPKWLFPMVKVMSALVNMVISLIPMGVVMLITGVPVSKSMLLLPFVVVFMFLFCLGVSLILSAMMVFFRDVQFLWSVMLTMLNFFTPIFYPESIIPTSILWLYRMNPLYQIITFMRTITLGGTVPSPASFLYCILASSIPLVIGLWAFRKHQNEMVLYL